MRLANSWIRAGPWLRPWGPSSIATPNSPVGTERSSPAETTRREFPLCAKAAAKRLSRLTRYPGIAGRTVEPGWTLPRGGVRLGTDEKLVQVAKCGKQRRARRRPERHLSRWFSPPAMSTCPAFRSFGGCPLRTLDEVAVGARGDPRARSPDQKGSFCPRERSDRRRWASAT